MQPLAARDIAPRVAQLAARSEWPDVREAAAAAAALQARLAGAPAAAAAAAAPPPPPPPAQPPGLASGSIGGYPLLGAPLEEGGGAPLEGVEAAWRKLRGDVEAAAGRFAALARLLRAGPGALVDARAPPLASAQGPMVPFSAAFLDGADFLEQALPRLAALISFGANCERVVMDEALFSRTLAVHEAGTLLQEAAAAVAAGGAAAPGAPDFPQLAPAAALDGPQAPPPPQQQQQQQQPKPPPQRAAASIEALADLFAPAAAAAAAPPQLLGGVAADEGEGGVSPVVMPRPLSGAPLLPPPPRSAANPLVQRPAPTDPFDSL